jgi:hypothetical protein
MSEKKEMQISNSNDFDTFFSDIIKIEANPETVSLIFGIRSSDNLSAIANHKAIMTLPHFLRLAEVCNNTAKNIIEQIEKGKTETK